MGVMQKVKVQLGEIMRCMSPCQICSVDHISTSPSPDGCSPLRRPTHQWPESTLDKPGFTSDPKPSADSSWGYTSEWSKNSLPWVSASRWLSQKAESARLRSNDLCSLLSRLARRARGTQGRPGLWQGEGGGREKLRCTFVLKKFAENFYKC